MRIYEEGIRVSDGQPGIAEGGHWIKCLQIIPWLLLFKYFVIMKKTCNGEDFIGYITNSCSAGHQTMTLRRKRHMEHSYNWKSKLKKHEKSSIWLRRSPFMGSSKLHNFDMSLIYFVGEGRGRESTVNITTHNTNICIQFMNIHLNR